MAMRLLVVDDEEDFLRSIVMRIELRGIEVHGVTSGTEALEYLEAKSDDVDIVLLDIKMPGMDGIELLQKIKYENPETEVIMITGHGDMDLAIRSLKYEATDFITKPINVDALEIALQRTRERILTREKLQEYTESLERLIQEKTELQSHLSTLGLMIGSISHGIKGLLTGLDAGMYLLDSGFAKNDGPRIQEGWEVTKSMVERIRKMVSDILFYTKERNLKWERIDALSFADEVARVVEHKMKAHAIEFVTDFDAKAGQFEIDTSYVHAALINILENAIDACLRDPSKPSHKIAFTVRYHKDYIRFDVFDNGTGMDEQTQAKLFTPLFSSKGDKGTGLGLFIANKIVEQHGGNIDVKSTPGQGSLFSVKIPRKLPESAKMTKTKEVVPCTP
jgi:signal transduction histidine kinase